MLCCLVVSVHSLLMLFFSCFSAQFVDVVLFSCFGTQFVNVVDLLESTDC